MSKLLLPGLQTARGTALIIEHGEAAAERGCPYDALVQKYGQRAVERFRYAGQVTSAVSVEGLDTIALSSWNDLARVTYSHIQGQLEAGIRTTPHSLKRIDKELVEERLLYDGRAGASQMVAFLQIIPRVLYRSEFKDPVEGLQERVRLSKGLMVRWSKLNDTNDAVLAYGASAPKPNLRTSHPHDGLRFHTKWFEEKPNGAVGFRPEKLPHMLGENYRKLQFGTPDTAVLGCPAVNLVPALYDAMSANAMANGLFVRTYLQERANHGYEDRF